MRPRFSFEGRRDEGTYHIDPLPGYNVFDAQRSHTRPIAFVADVDDAQLIVDALNAMAAYGDMQQ